MACVDICLWKISGANVIPNGSRQKQSLHRVMKFVSFLLAASNRICQNPQEVSRIENTWAPASLGIISSNVGWMYLSCLTALFKHFRSTHTRTCSLLNHRGTPVWGHCNLNYSQGQYVPEFFLDLEQEGMWHCCLWLPGRHKPSNLQAHFSSD